MQSVTKEEKQGLIGALVFSIVLYLFSRELLVALPLPFGMYLIYFVANRAYSANWLVRLNEEEAVFRKPTAMRVVFGTMALAFGGIIALWVHLCLPGKHPQDIGMGVFGLVVLLIFELVFLFSIGPMDTRFDFGRGRIFYRMGFPLLSWRRSADKSEVASLRVTISQRRGSNIYLKWKGSGRMSGTVAQFGTAEEARMVAEQIGSQLGLPVELRDLRSMNA